jgi:hypothetical protein
MKTFAMRGAEDTLNADIENSMNPNDVDDISLGHFNFDNNSDKDNSVKDNSSSHMKDEETLAYNYQELNKHEPLKLRLY